MKIYIQLVFLMTASYSAVANMLNCTEKKTFQKYVVCSQVIDPIKFKKSEFVIVDCTAELEDGYQVGICSDVDPEEQKKLKEAQALRLKKSKNNEAFVSGHLFLSRNKCTVDWPRGSMTPLCSLKSNGDTGEAFFEMDFSSFNLRQPPACIFQGAFNNKTKKRIEVYVSLWESRRIWINLYALKIGDLKDDLIVTYICDLRN